MARSCVLTVVFVAYGKWAWSFLLTVEIRFGLFLLTVEYRFGLFYLRFPPSGSWIWSFLLTVPPPSIKKTSSANKKAASPLSDINFLSSTQNSGALEKIMRPMS